MFLCNYSGAVGSKVLDSFCVALPGVWGRGGRRTGLLFRNLKGIYYMIGLLL